MSKMWRRTFIVSLLIIGLLLAAKWLVPEARAHDWYTLQKDPQTLSGCCGGSDCAPVPLDANWVQPVADGFHVVMTLEESRKVNPNSIAAVDAFVPWSRVQSPPAHAEGPPALYHVCISSSERRAQLRGGIYCLFAVPSL